MPLRVKCGGCGRELVLEDVFHGAYCRCRHCRQVIQVPRSTPASAIHRPAVRPERPPPVGARVSLTPPPASAATPARETARRRTFRSFYSQFFGVALVCLAATTLSVSVWQFSGPRPRALTPHYFVAEANDREELVPEVRIPRSASEAFEHADPLRTFGGVPLREGDVIAYVVDGDASMAPYIGSIAYVINSVNAAIPPGTIRFGVVLATGGEGLTVLEVAEPTCDLEGARSVLTARLPGGRTDLSEALGRTIDWDASTVFLVLAAHVDREQFNILQENAEQTGAVVNIFAMGEAARQPELEVIAKGSGGVFMPLTAQKVNDWVQRVQEAKEAAETAEAAD